jgi:hypothetical protein
MSVCPLLQVRVLMRVGALFNLRSMKRAGDSTALSKGLVLGPSCAVEARVPLPSQVA